MHYVGEAAKLAGQGLSAAASCLSEPLKSFNDAAKSAVDVLKACSFDWHELLPASVLRSFHDPLGSFVVFAVLLNAASVLLDVVGIAREELHACHTAAVFCLVNILIALAHIGFALHMQKAVTSSGTRDLEEPLVESEATTELLSGVLVERFKKFFLYDILVLAYTVGVVLAFLFNINFALSGAAGCPDQTHIMLKWSGDLQTLFPLVGILWLIVWFMVHSLDACCCGGKWIPKVRGKHVAAWQEDVIPAAEAKPF
mmetsp:Transcript_10875/g.24689  ORF Transcript_10875/g.24689 Transcript_10875/m.24689 type:complete len:256 (+) Transcript_10875:92-859(+)